ncbi:unnamed protein product [Phyllotreta striolata]|uniref:CUB domain-containing protein n=1 Tax=Phyllotreta striolata TaxID=444603 RepID=A0A9N9XUY8_PHYSR|nr:unnamed protein product [Phyllotreta striolata]
MDPKILGLVFLLTAYFYLHSAFAYWAPGFVRFPNNVCNTLENFSGVCLRKSQCAETGGVSSGTCANGIGRCCLHQGTCGGSSRYNNTYFINTNFPNPAGTASFCTFSIIPESRSICQIRLDFLSFTLSQPDGTGRCVFDSFIVTGAGSTVPIICGENTGQHVYLMVNGVDPIQLSITISTLVSLSRSFNIKITQIACDCPTLAPAGCLQYYTAPSATVSSFNYGMDLNGNINNFGNGTMVAGTRQLANTNYGICVNMLPGFCSITWAQSADPTSFTITQDTAADATVSGLPSNPLVGGNCTTDYVVIPNPYYPNRTAVMGTDRFCGNQFLTVTTSSKPFVLRTVTDGNENADAANRGFALTYSQQACSNTDALVLGK